MTVQSLNKERTGVSMDGGKPVRLNLGCGGFPLDGYINVDAVDDHADVRGDIRLLEFKDVEEVQMTHVLEHISWHDSVLTLEKVRSWMRPGAELTVEVPDMEAILARGTGDSSWVQWVYGCQSHSGEFHRAGFTAPELERVLARAGFVGIRTETFLSNHPMRVGFPCLKAVACA